MGNTFAVDAVFQRSHNNIQQPFGGDKHRLNNTVSCCDNSRPLYKTTTRTEEHAQTSKRAGEEYFRFGKRNVRAIPVSASDLEDNC